MKRWHGLGLGLAIALAVVLSACHGPPHDLVLTVNTTVDGGDALPGDGVCEMTTGAGDCSVRAAVDEANASAVSASIELSAETVYPLTLTGVDDTNAAGDLDIAPASGAVWFYAPPPGAVIDASGGEAALDVHSGIVWDYRVGATGSAGSGWHVDTGASLLSLGLTLYDNAGPGATVDAGGLLTMGNGTISGNGGPGVTGGGTFVGEYLTVTDNVDGLDLPTTLTNSIVADQAAGSDCSSPVTSKGGNLDRDGTCGLTASGDRTGGFPGFDPLGGPGNPVHQPDGLNIVDALGYGDNALCGPDSPKPADQLGTPRPSGVGCERGAVEQPRPRFTVDTPADEVDVNPGDGVCAAASGCTLRAAIDEVNAVYGDSATIVIADGVDPTLDRAGSDEDDNVTGDLDIGWGRSVLLIGNGATVDAGGFDRALDVHSGHSRLWIHGLTVTGGDVVGDGGGIRQTGALMTVVDSTVIDNSADRGGGLTGTQIELLRTVVEQNTATDGGGAWIDGSSSKVRDSTVAGNSATDDGGGLLFEGGTNRISGSLIMDNTAADAGGGILNADETGYLTPMTSISNSTVTGNRADEGAGVHGGGASGPSTRNVSIELSTIAGNYGDAIFARVGVTCDDTACWPTGGGGVSASGSIVSGTCDLGALLSASVEPGYGVFDSDTCNLQPTDVLAEPRLGTLVESTGHAPALVPFADSPALDLIPTGTYRTCDGTHPDDQFDAARPAGPGCDAGAIEGDNGLTPTPLSLVVGTDVDLPDKLPGDGVCDTGWWGVCSLRAAIDEANAWPTDDTVTIAAGIDPVLTRWGVEEFNEGGDLDVVDTLTIDGQGATVDGSGLDRVIHLQGPAPLSLTLVDLTLTGGSTTDYGGGIKADFDTTVTLDDVVLTGNRSDRRGGGIYADELWVSNSAITGNEATYGDGGGVFAWGPATIEETAVTGNVAMGDGSGGDGGGLVLHCSGSGALRDSVVADNVAAGDGGGLWLDCARNFAVTGSTFSGNAATNGGAVTLGTGVDPLEVVDATMTGNTATDSGGALYQHTGTTTVVLSTIADNTSPSGSSFAVDGGSMTVAGSIVTSVGDACTSAVAVVSGGYNLTDDASCGLSDPTDLTPGDPLLGPLADNGGPTPTRLPGAGSPVREAVPLGVVGLCDGTHPTDQRGVVRPTGAACDVGAVEQ